MQANKIADAVDQFAHALGGLAKNLRDAATPPATPMPTPVSAAPQHDRGAQAGNGAGMQRADNNRVSENTMVQVPAGDLWRLVNRSRKMIRLAREGKIPNQQNRAPLCRAIKALKQQGAVKKPYNLRD